MVDEVYSSDVGAFWDAAGMPVAVAMGVDSAIRGRVELYPKPS
jgi:hypothetical protein